MPDLRNELAQSAAGLEVASNAAMTSLGLTPETFVWLDGKMHQQLQPQVGLPPSSIDHSASKVCLYGGLAVRPNGDFAFGHIQSSISEPVPEIGVTHSADTDKPSVPYFLRLLTFKKGLVVVDTPNARLLSSEGLPVVESGEHGPHLRSKTIYNSETGAITVDNGTPPTRSHDWGENRIIEQDVFELPEDVWLSRLATVIRTIKATSLIFDQIAQRDVRNVSWRIKETLYRA